MSIGSRLAREHRQQGANGRPRSRSVATKLCHFHPKIWTLNLPVSFMYSANGVRQAILNMDVGNSFAAELDSRCVSDGRTCDGRAGRWRAVTYRLRLKSGRHFPPYNLSDRTSAAAAPAIAARPECPLTAPTSAASDGVLEPLREAMCTDLTTPQWEQSGG